MAEPAPQRQLNLKLRLTSWKQLESLYERDLSRSALFLKSASPPPVGTRLQVTLTLPSGSTISLIGAVTELVPEGGRGPGIEIRFDTIPRSALWLIESSLSSAKKTGELSPEKVAAAREAPAPEAEGLDPARTLGDAETDLATTLKQELASLKQMNAYQVLEMSYEGGDDEVRAAFAKLAKRYHPDRFAKYESTEIRQIGSELFLELRNAYNALANPDARAKVLAKIRGERPHTGPTPAITVEGDVPKAPAPRPLERAARESVPPPAHIDAQIAQGKYEAALALYRIAVRKSPDDDQVKAGVELCEGLIALAHGDQMEAAQRFERAVALDPNNERAGKALAEIRRKVSEERRGFLGRLLKKKV